MPTVIFATTEPVTVTQRGANGYISTAVEELTQGMHVLLTIAISPDGPGKDARASTLHCFSLQWFVSNWDPPITAVTKPPTRQSGYEG